MHASLAKGELSASFRTALHAFAPATNLLLCFYFMLMLMLIMKSILLATSVPGNFPQAERQVLSQKEGKLAFAYIANAQKFLKFHLSLSVFIVTLIICMCELDD